MSAPTKNPDAITTPRPFFPNNRDPDRFFKLKLGPVLGAGPFDDVHVRAQGGRQYFLTLGGSDQLQFANPHPLAPAERYDWFVVADDARLVMLPTPVPVRSWADRPEAVKFGWLRDEQDVPVPSLDMKAAMAQYVAVKDLQWRTLVARVRELAAKGTGRDAAEDEEYAALNAKVKRMELEGPPLPPKIND